MGTYVSDEMVDAIKTHYIRHGGLTEVVASEHNSGTSTFTKHVTLTFKDGRIEHHKILMQGNHITKEVKILSTREYEPITPEKVLDGTVEVPPVGRIRKKQEKRELTSEQAIEKRLENLLDFFA